MSESVVLTVTDVHYGKKTPTFNKTIVRNAFKKLTEDICEFYGLISKGRKFDEVVVALLGDINDGTDIYASQAHHQDITDVEEQADEISQILKDFLLGLHRIFNVPIRVECVAGNHGRAGRGIHEAANWDLVAYKYLAKSCQEPGNPIKVRIPPKPDLFLQVIKIRKHHVLLYHGHEIRMYQSIPWYGIMQRLIRWGAIHELPRFSAALTGHFHTVGFWPINSIKLFASGTMITGDRWARQTLGMRSSNEWWMFGVSDQELPTWHYGFKLDGRETLGADAARARR